MPYLIADYLIDRLIEHGVERLFGVPAVFCAAVFDAAGRKAGFHTVVTNSDLEAGYAADGYGRAYGLSALAVSYGPGNLSIVNAVAGAYLERSPVVIIGGGPSQRNIDDQNATGVLYSHSMGKPHTDLDIFRNITAFCQRETDETKLPKLIDDAIKAALVTKHPVYFEAPKDLFSRPCSPPAAPIDTTVPAGAADAVATAILQDLATATNPVVVVGEEVQRYGLAAKVLTVLDRLQVRWTTTVVGKSVLPEQHPRFLGVFNGDKAPASLRNAIAQAGVIVALGAVFGSGHAALMIPRANKTIRVWDGAAVIRGGAPQSVGLPALVDRLDSHVRRRQPDRIRRPDARGRQPACGRRGGRAWLSAGRRRDRRTGVPRLVLHRHRRHLPRHLPGRANDDARTGLLHGVCVVGIDRSLRRCRRRCV